MKAISAGPFIHSTLKARSYPLLATYCLLPSVFWGFWRFGQTAIVLMLASVITALVLAWVVDKVRHRPFVHWAPALYIGLMLGMLMPPHAPVYVPVMATAFGVFFGFGILGSTGSSWIHPSSLALVFAHISWPRLFALPAQDDTGLLSSWFRYLSVNQVPGGRPMDLVGAFSTLQEPAFTVQLSESFQKFSGFLIPPDLIASFLGFGGSTIGTASPILLLLGSVVLFSHRVADWKVSASSFGVFAVFALTLGGVFLGTGPGRGDVLFFLGDGMFLLVLFYLNQLNSTLPMTGHGRVLYGALIGLLLWIALYAGRLPQGVVLVLIFANLFVPLIDARARVLRRFREALP